MITESEARKKWCPYAFTFGRLLHGKDYQNQSYGPQNRGFQIKGPLLECNCIASDCMAWRWGDEDDFQNVCDAASAAGVSPPKAVGYCGLAGKP